MKRSFYFNLVLALILLFTSCDSPLSDYEPKNDTEKNLKSILTAYVEARNNGDVTKLASMFHDTGEYVAGNGARWTKSQIAETDPDWWTQYGEANLINSKFAIKGNEATVSSTGKWGGTVLLTMEHPHIATLVKEDGKWLFVKIKTGN